MKNRLNSPLFSELLSSIKSGDARRFLRYFPRLQVDEFRALQKKVGAELMDPLFLRPAINVRREKNAARHKRDNLHSCVTYYRRMVRRSSPATLDGILKNFSDDYEAAAPGTTFFFSYLIGPQPVFVDISKGLPGRRITEAEAEKEYDAQKEALDENRKKMLWSAKSPAELVEEDEAAEGELGMKSIFPAAYAYLKMTRASFEGKREEVQSRCKLLLLETESDRGKPGAHPKPYNVFAYHLINACTRWKLDESRKYMFRKDGQHRLERNWDLIVLLLLDAHINAVELPDPLPKFIRKSLNTPAGLAIQALKNDLWGRYKNFPPLEGWSLPRKQAETGFRKLVATEHGGLQTIRL